MTSHNEIRKAPVPARGKQGIWEVPPDAVAAVLAQIGGV